MIVTRAAFIMLFHSVTENFTPRAITLAIAMSAKYLRQVRATVLDELSKDYVAGAKA